MHALLIIDMQNDFVLPGSPVSVAGALATVPNICRLLESFRTHDWLVLHVTRAYQPDGRDVEAFRRKVFVHGPQYLVPGTPGANIVAELAPLPGERVLIKPRFSAFTGTPLDLLLHSLGMDHLVVTGTQYPNCIRATVTDAVCFDYRVTLVTDACSAQTDEVARANIADLASIGVSCRTTDQVVAGVW